MISPPDWWQEQKQHEHVLQLMKRMYGTLQGSADSKVVARKDLNLDGKAWILCHSSLQHEGEA